MNRYDKIRDLHKFLLKRFRPKKKVILRFSRFMINHGSYKYSKNKHFITIRSQDSYAELISDLCHEWSHCLEHHKWGTEHHSNAWGIKYSIVYRAYLEWLNL